MKAVDSVAEPPQHGWRHRMGGDVPVQPRIVRKTQHLEQPFDRTPFAVESEPAIYVAGDCVHGDIERGCGSPVEPQFGLERSEEHTSELQSLMRISYAVFCLKKTNNILHTPTHQT